ncbi:MAG: DUF4465 domain-containing protein, partial [Planctomycetota bacterium]
MKRTILFFLLLAGCQPVFAETVIDFEELNVFNGAPPNGMGQYFNGYGAGANSAGFVSRGATFETNEFGPGFSYGNAQDTTSVGFYNQFAAFPGGGGDRMGGTNVGENYGMVNTGSGANLDGSPNNGALLTFGEDVNLGTVDVANATYTARYALDGLDGFDAFFGDARGNPAGDFDPLAQFDDDDFFLLRFTGLDDMGNETGQVDHLLADYRPATDFFQ